LDVVASNLLSVVDCLEVFILNRRVENDDDVHQEQEINKPSHNFPPCFDAFHRRESYLSGSGDASVDQNNGHKEIPVSFATVLWVENPWLPYLSMDHPFVLFVVFLFNRLSVWQIISNSIILIVLHDIQTF
jgi:hypothetical protein